MIFQCILPNSACGRYHEKCFMNFTINNFGEITKNKPRGGGLYSLKHFHSYAKLLKIIQDKRVKVNTMLNFF